MDTTNNNKEYNDNSKGLVKPRCINIDCAFNSSLNPGDRRNFCNHPNVFVAQEALEITIAICSEFRSKKDYKFEKPYTLIDLKDNTVSEIGSAEYEKGKAVTLESIKEANLKSEEV